MQQLLISLSLSRSLHVAVSVKSWSPPSKPLQPKSPRVWVRASCVDLRPTMRFSSAARASPHTLTERRRCNVAGENKGGNEWQRAGTSISSIYSTLVNYMRLHNNAIIRSHPPSQIVPKQTAKCSLLGCQAAGQRPSSSGHKGADAMASSILVSLQKALMDISPQWGSHAAVFMSFPKEDDVWCCRKLGYALAFKRLGNGLASPACHSREDLIVIRNGPKGWHAEHAGYMVQPQVLGPALLYGSKDQNLHCASNFSIS